MIKKRKQSKVFIFQSRKNNKKLMLLKIMIQCKSHPNTLIFVQNLKNTGLLTKEIIKFIKIILQIYKKRKIKVSTNSFKLIIRYCQS